MRKSWARHWVLRQVEIEEGLERVIQSMCEGATTAVKVKDSESAGFEVKVGVQQGSVLSPQLFIIVLEALSRRFRGGLPYELFYTDGLVLIAETKELLMEKLRVWKENMEAKGSRVNLGKTKVMRCCKREGKVEPSGKFPCGVCNKGAWKNSIECAGCKKWVYKACSKVKGSLNKVV
jgi:hypothetical protein